MGGSILLLLLGKSSCGPNAFYQTSTGRLDAFSFRWYGDRKWFYRVSCNARRLRQRPSKRPRHPCPCLYDPRYRCCSHLWLIRLTSWRWNGTGRGPYFPPQPSCRHNTWVPLRNGWHPPGLHHANWRYQSHSKPFRKVWWCRRSDGQSQWKGWE